MDLARCLAYLRPGASFACNPGDYASITEYRHAQPLPTLAEVEAAWVTLQQQDAAAASAAQTASTNQAAIESGILGAFTELRAFRDRTSTTLSVAQNIAILKTICRVLIWLGRIALKRLDGQS